MSKRWLPVTGTDPTLVVDASGGPETVALDAITPGRTVNVRRVDTSTNAVTVSVPSGWTLSGVANGTTTVGPASEREFSAIDGGYQVAGAVTGAGSVGSSQIADGSVMAADLGSDVAAAIAASSAVKGTYVGYADVGDYTSLLAPGGVTNPKRYSQIVTNFQSGHGWTSEGSGTFSLNNTTDYVIGSQSASVVTTGTGSDHRFKSSTLSAVDVTGKTFAVVIKVDDVSKLSKMRFQAGEPTWSNYYELTVMPVGSNRRLVNDEWALVTFTFAQQTSSVGTPPAKTNITAFRIVFNDTGAGPITVAVNRVALMGQSTYPNGVISFTFDDSFATQVTAGAAALDAYAMAGTAYVIADNIGTSGRLTANDLKWLERVRGWDIAGHAYSTAAHNSNYGGLTDAALRTELTNLRAWCLANGFRAADHFAYPGGIWSSTIEAQVRRYFSTARTLGTGPWDTAPPSHMMRLGAFQVSASTSLATVTAQIDTWKASGNWGILCFHDLPASGASGTSVLAATFSSIVDYVQASAMPVRTISEVTRSLAGL